MTLAWGDFLAVWGFLAVNILSPGPNVLNTIGTALQGGRAAGLAAAAGVGIGIGGWCLATATGMVALVAAWPGAHAALTAAAAVLLVLFGLRYLRSAAAGWRGTGARLAEGARPEPPGAAFRRSMAINALNPKALTTWLTVMSLFPLAAAGAGDVAVLCAGACMLSGTIHTGYALFFSSPPAARLYLRWGWMLSGAAGLFFLAVAAALAGRLAGPR